MSLIWWITLLLSFSADDSCDSKSGTISKSENRNSAQKQTEGIGIFENDQRILLIGQTGVGKSTTGNTILGKDVFVADKSGETVTKKTEYARSFRYGRNLLVVDNPGLFDTSIPNKDTISEHVYRKHMKSTKNLHKGQVIFNKCHRE